MLLIVNNGSVYTKKLTDFLTLKDVAFKIKSPHLLSLDTLAQHDSFILCGRRKNEKKINQVNSKIITHCIKNDAKMLGICYGAEILALTLGGTIKRSHSLQKGNETVNIISENQICSDSMMVFESHGFEISRLPEPLVALGESKNCKYELVQYGTKPIFGTQFHPEMSKDGNNLIEKFCHL